MSAASVVVETWNLGDAARDPLPVVRGLERLLGALVPQLPGIGAELVITHDGLAAAHRAQLDARVGHVIRWVAVAPGSGYYVHKNQGFEATCGQVVAFIDGDCQPAPSWLAALLSPMAEGARVVAGATSYPGVMAPLANRLDFPYFDHRAGRPVTIDDGPREVRNFFANNVAFSREVFAARRYPTIEPMFHGQCQVLALRLREDGVPIRFAQAARVTHAWPDRDQWLRARLLRGADTASLLPYVAAGLAPGARAVVSALGPAPALAVLGARALIGSWWAVRRGPLLRGLGLIAGVTLIDSIGAIAAPLVYRSCAVRRDIAIEDRGSRIPMVTLSGRARGSGAGAPRG